MPTPHVLIGDQARSRLKEGMDLLARLIILTLGPHAGIVAATKPTSKNPETLTSSAVIARRMVEIPGRGANVGAMMMRHAVWEMHEQLGDGAATTAALAHDLLAGGHRMVAAGADPMMLRRGMERGLELTIAALREQARPLDSEQRIAGLAHAATGDAELSRTFGTIFARLGPEATIAIEEYAATYLDHKILEGASWEGSFVSPFFVANTGEHYTRFAHPGILVTDRTIDDPAELIPLLERFVQAGGGPLLILADDLTGQARAMLLANRQRGLLNVVAAKLEAVGDHRRNCYEDIAIATGAHFFARDRSDRLESADVFDLGNARLAQVDAKKITIVGGGGNPDLIEARRAALRRQVVHETSEDARRKLIERLGRLADGMAVLKLGAASDSERTVRKEIAERFIRFIPQAVEEGVVAGGGAAYLACRPALAHLAGAGDEHAAGVALVRDALAAPMQWLARNAGLNPSIVLAQVEAAGHGYGYDVVGEQVADMWEANILDAAKVARIALATAVSTAAMALTTEVIVLRRRPIVATTP